MHAYTDRQINGWRTPTTLRAEVPRQRCRCFRVVYGRRSVRWTVLQRRLEWC